MRVGIGRIQNEISLIHKLPCDLLKEVFHHACWSDQHKAPHPAVTLSHVCCQWRAILLSTPQFWCGVTFDGRDPSFATACLARSGNLPLDVTAQFNYTGTPGEDYVGAEYAFEILESEDVRWRSDECREGLTLLAAERDRVHRLYCILLGSAWIEDSIPNHDFFEHPLKNLQELWCCYHGGGYWPLPPQLFGASLESLRYLRLENVEIAPVGWIKNLISLECVNDGPFGYDTFRIPEFFSRNVSLQSLKLSGFYIHEEDSPRIHMDNLTSLTLDCVPNWYILFDLLAIKNLDGGTFTTISFSGGNGLTFSAVNSIGFSFTAPAPGPLDEDPRGFDCMRWYFSEATLVRLEDTHIIRNIERLFPILHILGISGGDMGRLEIHAKTEYCDAGARIVAFAMPFLPRLGTLAVYLPDWAEPSKWVEVMAEDLFGSDHPAGLFDDCRFEIYDSESGIFLSANGGELRAGFENGGSYGILISRSQQRLPPL
jgi:hypothetical protein